MTAPFDPSRAQRAQPVHRTPESGTFGGPEAVSQTFYGSFGKRALDILIVIAIVPAIVPVILLLAALVALDGGRPFYTQVRVGRRGETYRMWKLRTMVIDAEERLKLHLQSSATAREEWNQSQKLRNDPRITRLGRFLRKTSLDELPQAWNVLTGDMSLVGPRPILPSQVQLYTGSAYYRLRPGITGMWQVSSRNNCEFVARAPFDQEYERRMSFATDLRLMLATLVVVFKATGH